jgi:hypothetical protein
VSRAQIKVWKAIVEVPLLIQDKAKVRRGRNARKASARYKVFYQATPSTWPETEAFSITVSQISRSAGTHPRSGFAPSFSLDKSVKVRNVKAEDRVPAGRIRT